MNERILIAAAGVMLALTAHELQIDATPRSQGWLLALWFAAVALLVLMKSHGAGRARALAPWSLVLPLAALDGPSGGSFFSLLSATAFLVGAMNLLGVRMFVPEIIVTDQDIDRLTRLLDVLPPSQRAVATSLESELARAQVVAPERVPNDVVTMNSRVVFEDEETGKRSEVVLGYPHSVNGGGETVSILAPVGMALLGLRRGQSIDWRMPSGRCKRIRVVDIPYQPEAAGDFHL